MSPNRTLLEWFTIAAPIVISTIALVISWRVSNAQRELQERQFRKDLFDRIFDIYTKTREFMDYAMRNDGDITLTGSEYSDCQETLEKADWLCPKAHAYLVEVEKTSGGLYAYKKQDEARAVSAGDVALMQKGNDLKVRLFDTLWKQRREAFRPYLDLEKRKRW